jgi:hypothetical protein
MLPAHTSLHGFMRARRILTNPLAVAKWPGMGRPGTSQAAGDAISYKAAAVWDACSGWRLFASFTAASIIQISPRYRVIGIKKFAG